MDRSASAYTVARQYNDWYGQVLRGGVGYGRPGYASDRHFTTMPTPNTGGRFVTMVEIDQNQGNRLALPPAIPRLTNRESASSPFMQLIVFENANKVGTIY